MLRGHVKVKDEVLRNVPARQHHALIVECRGLNLSI